MPVRRETRSEAQAFIERLGDVHSADRARLIREHCEFMNEDRPTDADFASARPREKPVQAHRPTTMGKDASAVAAKTIARSGKKKVAPRQKGVDEPDDEEEDDHSDYVVGLT
ncbi:hypothetical protein ON010_g17851 [Phytophthora cinnamomi]|nr:hypothetical protein ON010_g17851 [Phytophthora cinnamomi]